MTDSETQALAAINALDEAALRSRLQTCCGASRWVERMAMQRPYRDIDALLTQADSIWRDLSEADWLQAFACHPKIGDVDAIRRKYAAQATWSLQEQKGVSGATEEVLIELAKGNLQYEARFGFLFLVCATGKSANEMLAILQLRLPHDRATEVQVAMEEQAKILALRIRKWLAEAGENSELGVSGR